MKGIIVSVLVAASLATHPINHKMTKSINERQSLWKAMNPEDNPLSQLSVEEIKAMLGTHIVPTSADVSNNDESVSLSGVWDWRVENPECAFAVRNQGQCGSCWAFGAAGALSHRHCLKGNKVQLSEQNLVDCSNFPNMGCNGGMMWATWSWIQKHGLVTEECMPYYSGENGTDTRGCLSTCEDKTPITKRYACATNDYDHTQGKDNIAREIKTNGATELAFTVYEDFINYASGIYVYDPATSGNKLGGHAVIAIGYGHDEETGIDYWICQNSWRTTWGDKGYFKIRAGDVGSSDQIYSCKAAAGPMLVSE